MLCRMPAGHSGKHLHTWLRANLEETDMIRNASLSLRRAAIAVATATALGMSALPRADETSCSPSPP